MSESLRLTTYLIIWLWERGWTDSLRIGWNWPEVRDRLTMLVIVGIRINDRSKLFQKPSSNRISPWRLLVRTVEQISDSDAGLNAHSTFCLQQRSFQIPVVHAVREKTSPRKVHACLQSSSPIDITSTSMPRLASSCENALPIPSVLPVTTNTTNVEHHKTCLELSMHDTRDIKFLRCEEVPYLS